MTATLSPAEARFILEAVGLPALRFEHTVTHAVIAAIAREHMEFRPAAGSRTARDLARHIASVELRSLEAVAAGAFDEGGAAWDAVDGAALADLYAARFAPALERLAAIDGEALLRVLDYKGIIQMPALGFVQLAINHTIHHRGQLSVYLRAVGVAVPSIYG